MSDRKDAVRIFTVMQACADVLKSMEGTNVSIDDAIEHLQISLGSLQDGINALLSEREGGGV
jgi:hypothetical protein